MSVNDHIAPGTCNGCDVGRHYDGATDRLGCVCCRTVDEWVGIRAAVEAGEVVAADEVVAWLTAESERLTREAVADRKGLDRWCNYQDRLFAVMSSDEIRAFEARLSEGGWVNDALCRHVAERDALSAQLEREKLAHIDDTNTLWSHIGELHKDLAADETRIEAVKGERDAMSAVIDNVRFIAKRVQLIGWGSASDYDKGGLRLAAEVLSALAAGLTAPVGETPGEPGGAYRRAVDFAAAKTQNEKIAVLTRGLPALPVEEKKKPWIARSWYDDLSSSCETPGETR